MAEVAKVASRMGALGLILLPASLAACGGRTEGRGFESGFPDETLLSDLSEAETVTLCERQVDYLFSKLTAEVYCLWRATNAPGSSDAVYRQECAERYEKCRPEVHENRAAEWAGRLKNCHDGEPLVVPGEDPRECPISIADSDRCLVAYWDNALSAALISCSEVTLEDRERRTRLPEQCHGFRVCF